MKNNSMKKKAKKIHALKNGKRINLSIGKDTGLLEIEFLKYDEIFDLDWDRRIRLISFNALNSSKNLKKLMRLTLEKELLEKISLK